MKYIISFLLLLFYQLSFGQCKLDRHNTSLSSNWISCDISMNPNALRGDSHWINYDLGEVRKLGNSHIWNINNPTTLDEGARQLAIDYSLDGVNWEHWGTWDISMAEASGLYEGEEGPDFDGLEARHLLFTILSNHGGACSGLGEIRVELAEPSSTDDQLAQVSNLTLRPNPAIDRTTLVWTSKYAGSANVELLDMSGRKIKTDNILVSNGEQILDYNLDHVMQSGQYLIKVVTPSETFTAELSIIKTK